MFRTGRVTVFRPKELQPKKLPKPLVAVFVLAQLFSGINFGFFAALSSKHLRTLANILSALSGILVVASFIFNYPKWDFMAPACAAQYLFIFLTMRFSKYTVFNFLSDLMEIDYKFKITLNSRFGLTTSICVLFACCCRIVMSSTYCVCLGCFINGTISLIMYLFFEMRHVISIILATVQVVVYYVIYLRVKYMKSAFEQGVLKTKQVALMFKAVSACFKKISVPRDTLIVVCFMTDFINSVGYFWGALALAKENSFFLGWFFICLEITLSLVRICVPSLVAEMISAQIEDMLSLIQDWLLSGSNGIDDEDLLRLLRYVKACPLILKAWRLVPVDLKLPVSLLNMSVTYVIVLVQLTHLY